MATPVPENINFSEEEEKVIQLWKELDAFRTSLKQSSGRPRYSFYDGPPFATGLPHYGHMLAGTIKDIITRYAHQSGYHVERRFGWDCHGLPVEYEIDKMLGIKGPQDVMKIGIENYNKECRKIVMRYSKEWEEIVWRMGRWIDFKNDYKTMYPTFMESVWWVFKELYTKGMVYKGVKVMPFSTACNTPLSNFESGQNYKDVTDPAVIVSFPLIDEQSVSLIAWTTTPWTLPSNLSICVNPDKVYVKVKDNTTNKVYIMMEARLEALFRKPEEYSILERFLGKVLFGKSYEPIFPYFSSRKKDGAFRVLCDGYVTEESGTGVVHQAPYFGEDDYRVCLAAGVIKKDDAIVCPVDESGCFTEEVADFKGEYVKDADKGIIKQLKNRGRLVHQGTVKHNYPFCWRSDSPLIYKAVPSWFVRVEQIARKLIESNSKTYWVPEYVKDKRFANWLKDARDWAISRNRYWGTPIPLWISDDGKEVVCIGSIEELEELTGAKITDLHREHVDKLTIPSAMGKGILRRIPEVFDCWFESGSMPYAQVHYPFEKKAQFDEAFPADFIAEGIDQTRGWFYTLLVLSTALFGKAPFKNLICNGLVLAGDGQKMSKRKKNYPDPMEVISKYGADALRLYLINSPAVRGDNLRFKEEGVRDILKDVFLPWYNAYRFLVQNLNKFVTDENVEFTYNKEKISRSSNIMDRWIMSCTQTLLVFVREEMSKYHLYTVVPVLIKFIDNLTNWYVRFNRKRLKGEGGKDDCLLALETLFGVLFTLVKVMAPFTPFLTEVMFQNLKQLVSEVSEDTSIHYLFVPEPDDTFIEEKIERAVSKMQTVIELGRIIRDRKTLPVKYPLFELVIVHQDEECLNDILSLEKYILEELNIKKLTVTTDKSKYGVQMRAEPEHKTLGARLRTDFKSVMQAIKQLSDDKLQAYLNEGKITVLGHELGPEDLRIMFTVQETSLESKYEAHAEGNILVMLDVQPDRSLMDEGLAREVINRIQKLRKKAHLVPSDVVTVYYDVNPSQDNLLEVVGQYQEFIENTIKASLRKVPYPESENVIIKEQQQLKGSVLSLVVTGNKSAQTVSQPTVEVALKPLIMYVNVQLCKLESGGSLLGPVGTILLENPQGHFLDFDGLVREIKTIFGLQGKDIKLELASRSPLTNTNGGLNLKLLHQNTVLVLPRKDTSLTSVFKCNETPQCAFVNVTFNGKQGTILIENPKGCYPLSLEDLNAQVANIFNIGSNKFKLSSVADECVEVKTSQLNTFSGKTLYVVV